MTQTTIVENCDSVIEITSGIDTQIDISWSAGLPGPRGISGDSGFSGYSGYSGISGYSGYSGISGYSGYSGISGYSGASGLSGFSGFSGISGYSGYSGYSGSGISGYSGYSGVQGIQGISGYSGRSGYSGAQGASGVSGYSGYSGAAGLSGYSGYSGSGISGYSGYSGAVGASGLSGYSGFSGYSGAQGASGVGGALGYWGSFWDTTDQVAAAANTPYSITLNQYDADNLGITVVSGSRITFANTGIYSLTFSIQFANPDSQIHDVNVWLRKNDSGSTGDVPDSDTKLSLQQKHGSTDGYGLMTVNYMMKLNAGDFIEMIWSSDHAGVSIQSVPAGTTPVSPSIPGVIFTAQQVMNTQSGFSGFSGRSGFSGYSGSGISGYSGYSGYSGAALPSQTGNANKYLITNGVAPSWTDQGVFTTLGIGATPVAGQASVNGAQITGATTSYANVTTGSVQSGVTSSAHGYATSISTAASAFTLNNLIHFRAIQGTKGAGSVVNIQQGFYVNSNLTGATNNYGFYGNIAAGTGRYNLYMAGSADNYLAGSLGIGTASLSGSILSLGTSLTGTTAANAVTYNGQINSDASIYATIYNSSPSIQASAALTNVYHFDANQGTKGAGASITTQFGFTAESSLTGATNNYGFYGGIASGTGRYNLYMAGTADNYLAGNLGIGANAVGNTVVLAKALTGAVTSRFVWATASVLSDVTTNAVGFATNIGTQATAFTLGELNHYFASQAAIGAGSAVINQYGYRVNTTLTGATNNYGFYGNIAAGTGRYNLYMAGTADNWFSGNVVIGGAGGLGYTTGSGGAVTQTVSRTSGVTLNKTNGAITLVSAAGSVTYQSFTVTNSTVAETDTIIINQKSGTDLYEISITAVATGSFRVTYRTTGGTTTEQPVFNFSVIKAVTA
jgi:hypothetical protein